MSVSPYASNYIAGNQTPLLPTKSNPQYQSQLPRWVVKIDGNAYLGESFRCTQNVHGAADEATVVLPIDGATNTTSIDFGGFSSAYPDWTVSIERSQELGNANVPVLVEIWGGLPADASTFSAQNLSGLVLRFRGIVDLYSVVLEDNKTTFTCRSLAFPLISTKITVPFPREDSTTTTAFIQQQASRFGLVAGTPLTGNDPALMIDVLGGEFISGVRGMYIWDLMLQCALLDAVDIYVDRNGVIQYQAAALIKRTLIQYIWGTNIKGVTGTHSPQFSKNVQVAVHSWTKRTRTTSATRYTTDADGNTTSTSYTRQVQSTPIFGTTESLTTSISQDGTVSTSLSSSSGGGAGTSTGTASNIDTGKEKYTFFVKNKTLAQCQAIAQQRWADISMHEYGIKLTVPVTQATLSVMDVTANIEIFGHPMAHFNGLYWPRQIIESFDMKTGWTWEIDAVNHQIQGGSIAS